MATGIIVCDSELFIGERCQLVSDIHHDVGRFAKSTIANRVLFG
jgi:hypothetical protein